jgi:hypothetical protein
VVPFPVVLAGLVAGALMALFATLFEAVLAQGEVWAPTMYVAALLLRPLQTHADPATFSLDPVLLGALLLILASIGLSIAFGQSIAPRAPNDALPALGAAYGAAVFVLMSVVFPLVNPVVLQLHPISLGLAHVAWGASLGYLLQRAGWGTQHSGRAWPRA